ncbi:MAG: Na+/H+ antiporter NhaC family protein [Dongiaceae bacterium]
MASDEGTKTSSRAARKPSLFDAIVPAVALIGLLALSFVFFGDTASSGPNQIALLFCAIIAAGVAYKNGLAWEGIRRAALDGISSGLAAIMILLAVGALIGTWALSGTIVAMVYYGLQILNPHYFYATTALICAVIGLSIGSSWTVAGTLGIGLMGVAASMNLSPEVTAGAIISGAYFGDKASPLSDTANLATAAAGSGIYEHIRESLFTSVPALLVALVLFGALGSPGDFDAAAMLSGIESSYVVSLWAFIPLLIVFGLSVAKFSPFITIFIGALAGGVVAVILDPSRVIAFAGDPNLVAPLAAIKGIWMALANGYVASSGDAAIDAILTRGGMSSMMNTVWLIITALTFGATVEHAGLLNRLIDPVIHGAKSVAALVATVVATCIGANIVTSDQYISIALPARLFRPEFLKRGLAPVLLSRVVGDSATVTSPLIPWNSCGAYMAATLGVPATGFFLYSFFNLLNPVMTILFATVGFRVLRSALGESKTTVTQER